MDLLRGALDNAVHMLQAPLFSEERIYWVYLVTALLLALASFRDLRAEGGERRGFLRWVFDRDVWLHPSAKVDYAFFFVDALLIALLVLPWLGGSAAGWVLGRDVATALVPRGAADGLLPGWALALLLTLAFVVAMDLALFLVHWAQHRVPLLWEFHKVHHSAEVLTPITVYRMHPLDNLLNMTFTGLFTGAVLGASAWALPDDARLVTVAGLDVLTFLFYVVGYNLRHSHVWLDWGPALSHVLVSPAQHQIHHSVDPRHWDKNMGFMLAVWDWLFGTLYVPRTREPLVFGLGSDETKEFSTVGALYLRPVRGALSALRRTKAAHLASLALVLGTLVALEYRATHRAAARPVRSVALEELTWTEVAAAVSAGMTTAIVPTGGTEQNGPHMALGKHNRVIDHTARRVAEALGDALVAPVIAYVPEGDVDPPTGHMPFAGTLTLPPRVFAEVLEHAARSLAAHGFTTICFLGDSAWNQQPQEEVARRLSAEWAGRGVRVLHVAAYYSENGQWGALRAAGESEDAIGYHAGIRDTSELLAVAPDLVRRDRLADDGGGEWSGVDGDPRRASAARGWRLLDLKVEAAVRQIRALRSAR